MSASLIGGGVETIVQERYLSENIGGPVDMVGELLPRAAYGVGAHIALGHEIERRAGHVLVKESHAVAKGPVAHGAADIRKGGRFQVREDGHLLEKVLRDSRLVIRR